VLALEIPKPKKVKPNRDVHGNPHFVQIGPNMYQCNQGVGKFFVLFETVEAAKMARYQLSGRQYNGRTVVASFYPEHYFDIKEFSII